MAEDKVLVQLAGEVSRLKRDLNRLRTRETGRDLVDAYLRLPGLRFFAPMSAVGDSGQAVDLVLGNLLTNNNAAQFSYDSLAPRCRYNGTTQYHSITDATSSNAYDIIGNETYIGSGSRGLTIGMWVQPVSLPGAVVRMFSKGTTTGNARAYSLIQNASNQFSFNISDNGTNNTAVADTVAFVTETWYFVVGRFDPSTETKIYVGRSTGLTTVSNTTSIPATLNNSATGLAIGAQADGTGFSDIRASMCFLCVELLSDAAIGELFEATRGTYKT